jgi:hypothetical protein
VQGATKVLLAISSTKTGQMKGKEGQVDRCITCLWFQEEPNEEVCRVEKIDGYCRAFPAEPNGGIPRKKTDFCMHHRPRRTGWELRIGSWLFRVEYKRTG